jgi:hypothetical protein
MSFFTCHVSWHDMKNEHVRSSFHAWHETCGWKVKDRRSRVTCHLSWFMHGDRACSFLGSCMTRDTRVNESRPAHWTWIARSSCHEWIMTSDTWHVKNYITTHSSWRWPFSVFLRFSFWIEFDRMIIMIYPGNKRLLVTCLGVYLHVYIWPLFA